MAQVEITGADLINAFAEFEGANGRQAKVLAVAQAADEAVALQAVQLGHVGHLDVVVDDSLSAGRWELRLSEGHRTDEQMAVDAETVDGRVFPYAGMAPEAS